MPYIEKKNDNTLQKIYSDNEVLQTKRLKSSSQIFKINDNVTEVEVTNFSIVDPVVYVNGSKLTKLDYNVQGQIIFIPSLKKEDIVEVVHTLDKPDSVEYFPLYHSEVVKNSRKDFILPWVYNSSLNNITIYKNGVLVDKNEYACPHDDIVSFHDFISSGTRLTFFSAVPTINSDIYGEYFNTFPTLGRIDFYGIVPPPGFVKLDGSIFFRREFPTAWLLISEIAIPDSEWLADANKQPQCFSTGDGVTTFRVPKINLTNDEIDANTIKCIKLYSAIINSSVSDFNGVQKNLKTLTERVDNRSFPRNLLINGSCTINTRDNVVKESGLVYGLDRWLFWRNLASASMTQETELYGETTSRKYMEVRTYKGTATESAISIQYWIENIFRFSGKSMVFSFMMKTDTPHNIYTEIFSNFGPSGSTEERNIAGTIMKIGTEWKRYSLIFKVPDYKNHQIDNTGGHLGIAVWLSMNEANSGHSYANSIGQCNGIFHITDFQLEFGEFLTEYELLPESLESSMCQYYCRKFKSPQDADDLQSVMRVRPREFVKGGYFIYDSELCTV